MACVGCRSGDDSGREDPSAGSTPEPTDPENAQPTAQAISLGVLADVDTDLDDAAGFLYVPEARAWLVRYPERGLESARLIYDTATLVGIERGLLALHQKCTHLGCRVPHCSTSQRFECPCHGAIFNAVGECIAGPAPRGMDRFPIRFEDDEVFLDARSPIAGLEQGVVTIDQEATGPSCVLAG